MLIEQYNRVWLEFIQCPQVGEIEEYNELKPKKLRKTRKVLGFAEETSLEN